MAGSNSSAFSSRRLTLTRDGRYTFNGSYGVSGSSDAGGGTASHAGTAARPDQDGRYKLEGYTLTLTARDGGTAVMSAFAPDSGSDGLLVLNGANYLKDGR